MSNELQGQKVAILAADGVGGSNWSSRGARCTVPALKPSCSRSTKA